MSWQLTNQYMCRARRRSVITSLVRPQSRLRHPNYPSFYLPSKITYYLLPLFPFFHSLNFTAYVTVVLVNPRCRCRVDWLHSACAGAFLTPAKMSAVLRQVGKLRHLLSPNFYKTQYLNMCERYHHSYITKGRSDYTKNAVKST